MSKKKKPAQGRRHPRVKKAIADLDKIHKTHKKLQLDVAKVKKSLTEMPHTWQMPHTA